MRWSIGGLVLLLLAACTGQQAATDAPFYTATPQVLQPPPLRTDSATAPAFAFDFEGGNPQSVQSSGSFHVTVSGDVTAETGTGSIVYNHVPRAGNVPARDKVFISASDATATQQIAFEFSPGLEAGTYSLTAPGSIVPGVVSAHYLRLSAEAGGIQAYNQNVSGTLVLLETGTVLSGAFEFSADWVMGDEGGATVTRTVTVSGEFTDVPYSRLDDPFANPVRPPVRVTLPPQVQGGP